MQKPAPATHTLAPHLSPNPLQVFSMPLNAAHHDEEEVAFIAFARATSRQQHITNFFICSGLFCSSLLLPLALDWSNKVLTVTILGAAVCLQVYYLHKVKTKCLV
jgi:hypothetical protein